MNTHTLWQSEFFKLSQSYDYRFPGYLFVECISSVQKLNNLHSDESQELIAALKLAEHLIHTLIRPERIYILKFGESEQRVHFHIVPRTAKLLDAYLRTCMVSPPYNGALITVWLWANANSLGHSDEEINGFISSARQLCDVHIRQIT